MNPYPAMISIGGIGLIIAHYFIWKLLFLMIFGAGCYMIGRKITKK